MKKLVLVPILTLLLVFNLTAPVLAYQPQDVSNSHWALPYIAPLMDDGIMYLYEDDEFKPSRPITRGEFAYSLAKTMELQPTIIDQLTDIEDHFAKGYISALVNEGIITGYPDHTFRPYKKVTRAEIITMLARSLKLNDNQKKIQFSDDYYPDVTDAHWASYYITLGTRLNMLNGYPDQKFRPNNDVTRAETAKLLVKLKNLEPVEGEIFETYPRSRKIKIETNDQIKTYSLTPNSLVGRNNRIVGVEDMLTSDQAYLLLNKQKEIVYLKSYGLITKEDAAQQVSEATNGFLTAEELLHITEGEWDEVTPRLRQDLTMRLLDNGLSLEEVQALYTQDWDTMKKTGKERLIEAISLTTNIPKTVVKAAINREWDTAKETAKTAAITNALQKLMQSSSLLS